MEGFMKAMPASPALHDYSKLEETEFALAISPCPQIRGSKDNGESTEFTCRRSGRDRRRQVQMSRPKVFDDNDLTETLTVGWAIALAIGVALVVYAFVG